jgi:hypothetical protein
VPKLICSFVNIIISTKQLVFPSHDGLNTRSGWYNGNSPYFYLEGTGFKNWTTH